VTSSNTKPEIVWSRRDRHLENEYDVITHYSAADEPIWTKFGSLMHADYGDVVEVATGRIPIWRTFVFPNCK